MSISVMTDTGKILMSFFQILIFVSSVEVVFRYQISQLSHILVKSKLYVSLFIIKKTLASKPTKRLRSGVQDFPYHIN